MALEQGRSTGIALNVTRTRVTVLTFNLTIISVMLSMLGGRERAYAELASLLESADYRRAVQAWQTFVEDPSPSTLTAPEALTPVSSLASKRIWRVYRRVMKQGGAITSNSPAEPLHELRITCKKLRYLMEFFVSLYPTKPARKMIKALKAFQDNLGEFHDLQVQQESLRKFTTEMLEEQHLAPETKQAMSTW